jgi:hypothetical protein
LVSALDAAMILLNPVVEIAIGAMAHTFAEFCPDRPWVAVVPICEFQRKPPTYSDLKPAGVLI